MVDPRQYMFNYFSKLKIARQGQIKNLNKLLFHHLNDTSILFTGTDANDSSSSLEILHVTALLLRYNW